MQSSEWAAQVKSTIADIEEDEIFLLRKLKGDVKRLLQSSG